MWCSKQRVYNKGKRTKNETKIRGTSKLYFTKIRNRRREKHLLLEKSVGNMLNHRKETPVEYISTT